MLLDAEKSERLTTNPIRSSSKTSADTNTKRTQNSGVNALKVGRGTDALARIVSLRPNVARPSRMLFMKLTVVIVARRADILTQTA